jgi:hypothetical protein
VELIRQDVPVEATLDEIMNGDATFGGQEIRAGAIETIVAVDRVASWGAAFEFQVDAQGSWSADGLKAVRRTDGRWEDIGSGGSHGDAWPTPWTPPPNWNGRNLMVMGSTGQDVEDAGQDLALIAAFGFVSRSATAIRVEADGVSRTITPTPCGGFIALAIGSGVLQLTPLDARGRVLSASETCGLP